MVAMIKLGRNLNPGEVVHHINGNGRDNRPENLEVMQRGAHNICHFKLPIDGERIKQLADQGIPVKKISANLGIGYFRTLKYLDSIGYKIKYTQRPYWNIDAAIEMIANGHPISNISIAMGLGKTTVRNFINGRLQDS